MADVTDAEIDAALERGRGLGTAEPRACHVRYDRKLDRVVLELTNGCTFAFPPRSIQGLESASGDDIARVEILGAGDGLHWDLGDTDISIAGLLAGRFGTRAFMARRAAQLNTTTAAGEEGRTRKRG